MIAEERRESRISRSSIHQHPKHSVARGDKLELEHSHDWQSESSSSSDADNPLRGPRIGDMGSALRLRDLNPLRLFTRASRFSYQRLPNPGSDGSQSSFQNNYAWERWRCGGRISRTKVIGLAITVVVVLALVAGRGYGHGEEEPASEVPGHEDSAFFPWQRYPWLDGYYNGVRTLVSFSKFVPGNRYNQSVPPTMLTPEAEGVSPGPPLDPVLYNPYPEFSSAKYLSEHQAVHECYLDQAEEIPARDIYAYPGVPQDLAQPMYGSYDELGMRADVCFDRFGRLGPYGYGYNSSHGGTGPGQESERKGSDKVFQQAGFVNYSRVDWGTAQRKCYEKNKARFEVQQPDSKQRIKRQAYVLRTWAGYQYTDHQILSLRAMINELSLKSGGEYDVHFLVHIKDDGIPIWADAALYNQTLQENVPREFWNLSTLWSEQQMKMYYPAPFTGNFANLAGSSVHGVYRGAHFALQWFSQQHPEYDFIWNWEMDVRYTGHYYEFHDKVGEWARKQPRKGLWERSGHFWLPEEHGDFANFTAFVEDQAAGSDTPAPIWGPVNDFEHSGMLDPPPDTKPRTSYQKDDHTWGVGEDADLITFNPLFDPSLTNWVFRKDATGYDRQLPIPPRRAAIITVARLSKRLLGVMHEETWRMKHTMFPEMWPPSVCLHHGLKAVYAPHPVYFDRDWDPSYMNQALNHPASPTASPFGWGENNLLGSTFYYNSGFAGELWRRWLGQQEYGRGGVKQEEQGTGRMCLRGTLLHPVKREDSPSG